MTGFSLAPARSLRLIAVLAAVAVGITLGATPARAAVTDPQTVVSLTFDDGNADQLAAVATLNQFGMKGTFFITTGFIDNPGWLTRADLTSIAAAGHEIAGHTVTHPDLLTLPADEATRQVCQGRATLADWGFPTRSFAYPFATADAATEAIVQACGFNSARGLGDIDTRFGCTGCGFAETIPPADAYLTRAPDEVDTTWTLADLENTVTNAETAGGGWVQLTFHHLCAGSCDALSVDPAVFAQFAAWLSTRAASNNTTVKTVGDVIGGAVKPVVPVTTTSTAAPGPGVNGVVNPSLETAGTTGLPQCWAVGGFGTNTAAFSTVSAAHTGTKAEQLVVSNLVSGDSKLILTQDLGACAPTVTPGHTYSLRAWYTSTVTTQFDVYLRNSIGSWSYWTSSPYFPAGSAYAQALYTTAAIPAGTTGLSFGLNLILNGTLVTDDYALYDSVGAPGILVPATPTVTGSASVGSTLTAVPGAWSPATAAFAHQWLRDGADIPGATSATYTPVAADLGTALSVRVTGSAPGYLPVSAAATSVPTAVVVAGTLVVGTPTITGTAAVGALLTAIPGTWAPAGVNFAYQWLANGTPIAGATAAGYTPVAADAGTTLTVRVTGTAPGYQPASAVSAPTGAVAAGGIGTATPVISGTASVGAVLTAIPGTWTPAGVGFAYQWLANGTAISGATSAGYTPVAADAGAALTVRVTGSAPGYQPASAVSAPTAPVSLATVTRVAGTDPYSTAIAVSQGFAPGVSRVYLVSGTSFADALSAGPAAAHFGGPVLLTGLTALPAGVRAELVRLHPGKIVIVGGTASVSAAVAAELAGIAPVARLAGADRYATSRLVASDAFGSLAATAYVATGADFPGALAAASAAARAGAPVVLVPAGGFLPDLATAALLRTLHTRTVKIAGGTADVTSLTEFWLKLQLGGASVTRYSGADRYATSAALNLNAFTSATTVYLASGTSYQDALVGSALAGAKSAPLYLTPATCVPRATLTAITRLGATRVVLIGTATALTGDVAALKPCP
ncbi:cell wall-binding repeat-containing protein [Cryobacterium sp. MDB2-10]|uniref:cell wall-binding repeat-containing protein n=1 Tax=Cryobacterium sp. MDB2-10 TaxID=1259177 RepID=UPI0010748E56|nr:cell wall-binding repeat-containing protein [Cryobacterium sp. MDB2-10]TFC21556.1 hypothetical protein E3O51_03715 [Cryobacterium sp. MDB2-10]